MSTSYQQKVSVKSSPEKIFQALTHDIDQWWGKVDKKINAQADVFTIFFNNAYWKFGVTEYKPYESLVWRCIGGEPEWNKEWIGTFLNWQIEDAGDHADISFLHEGLVPELHCFDICSTTWTRYITQSLKNYLEVGAGQPHVNT